MHVLFLPVTHSYLPLVFYSNLLPRINKKPINKLSGLILIMKKMENKKYDAVYVDTYSNFVKQIALDLAHKYVDKYKSYNDFLQTTLENAANKIKERYDINPNVMIKGSNYGIIVYSFYFLEFLAYNIVKKISQNVWEEKNKYEQVNEPR